MHDQQAAKQHSQVSGRLWGAAALFSGTRLFSYYLALAPYCTKNITIFWESQKIQKSKIHILTCPLASKVIWRVTQVSANVNSRSLYAVVRPSVCLSVGNARAPYSGGWNFQQRFFAIWYLGHPLTLTENFTEIVPGTPPVGGLNARGVATKKRPP